MYYIYHIEGVKVGASQFPEARVKAQGYSEFTILEVHNSIEIAEKREIELQVELGYGRDCSMPYSKTIENGKKAYASTLKGRVYIKTCAVCGKSMPAGNLARHKCK